MKQYAYIIKYLKSVSMWSMVRLSHVCEKLEYTKGAIRSPKSKDTQYKGHL